MLPPPLDAVQVFKQKKPIPFIRTFSPKLDTILGGGWRSEGCYVITGGPGSGKTTFVINVADYTANIGCPVVYVGAELTPQLVLDRWAARKLQKSWIQMIDLDPEKDPLLHKQYEEEVHKIQNLLWFLDPEQAPDYKEHISTIRNTIGPDKPILIIVDYLQDLAAQAIIKGQDPRIAVAGLSRELRFYAREQKCPIIIVSSTGRQFYRGDTALDDSAIIASAKDAGEVEYNVNAVIGLRQEKTSAGHYTKAMIAKNRFGINPAEVSWRVDMATGTFEETDLNAAQQAGWDAVIKIWNLVAEEPAKYSTPQILAKKTGASLKHVKQAIEYLAKGYNQHKLVNQNGYMLVPLGEPGVPTVS